MSEKKPESKKETHQEPFVGMPVLFYRQQAQSVGADQILVEHAIVTGMASKASNFTKANMAVNLRVLPDASGSGELQRSGIMFSPTPLPGRWGYNKPLEEYIRNVSKTNAP